MEYSQTVRRELAAAAGFAETAASELEFILGEGPTSDTAKAEESLAKVERFLEDAKDIVRTLRIRGLAQ